LSMLVRLTGTGRVRSVIAESVLLQASIANRESSAPSCTKSSRDGPVHRCRLFSFHSSGSSCAISDHIEAVHDLEFSSELGEAEISLSVLPEAKSETRTERSNAGFDS